MNHKNKVLSLITATAFLALPFVAVASDLEEVEMLSKSKINLTEAIALAEKHSGGKALSASIEDDSFSPTFEVSVTKDGKVYDVQIDGTKGEVTGSREDRD